MKGTNDGGEAKMDKELVLYEFINLLVRIAFQRANPTYGNFGNKREVIPPPGCLEEMITNCILPNARRDTSAEFKETVMQDEAVKGVLAEYKDKLKAWYAYGRVSDTGRLPYCDTYAQPHSLPPAKSPSTGTRSSAPRTPCRATSWGWSSSSATATRRT